MEIRSAASSGETSSTLAPDVDKGQSSEGFSELLAMLFNNMIIPSSNQYSLDINSNNLTDSINTTDNNELNNMLSIIDNLRISGGQLKDSESIQNFINSDSLLGSVLSNNSDFRKLLNLSDDVPAELQEFINNINSLSSKETVNLDVDTVDVLDIKTKENTTFSIPKNISDLLDAQTSDNPIVSELKKVADLINMQPTAFKTEKSSPEAVKTQAITPEIKYIDNAKDIKSIVETSTSSTNNSSNNQGEAKSIKPEEKPSSTFELTNNFEQAIGLNNIKNQNVNSSTPQPKVTESALIEKPQDIFDVTVKQFKTLKLPGSTEVTVKLRPEELGEISLKLVLEKGQINGSITAERKEIMFMLQNNLDQLKTDLKNENVNLNNLTVNLLAGEDFDRNNSRRGFSNKQNRSNPRIVQEFEEEIQSYDSLEGLNIIA